MSDLRCCGLSRCIARPCPLVPRLPSARPGCHHSTGRLRRCPPPPWRTRAAGPPRAGSVDASDPSNPSCQRPRGRMLARGALASSRAASALRSHARAMASAAASSGSPVSVRSPRPGRRAQSLTFSAAAAAEAIPRAVPATSPAQSAACQDGAGGLDQACVHAPAQGDGAGRQRGKLASGQGEHATIPDSAPRTGASRTPSPPPPSHVQVASDHAQGASGELYATVNKCT